MSNRRTGGRTRAWVVAMVTAGLGATALWSASSAGAAGLAFYDPPSHLPGGHGTLIRSKQASGLVPLAKAASTKLVLYTSMTPHGKRVAVSGSVSVPKGKPPKGGWPVITYAHGTTGTADVCAPSRNRTGGPAEGYISYIDPELNDWLKAGYAVVRTDYQGIGTPGPHAFLIGEAEGHSVLDMVRAAHQLNPHIGKRFLIAGHSQGGHAALFAAGEAKSYVPDLKLRGTVAYAPASHLKEEAQALPALTTPSTLTALATLVVQGATTESTPAAPIDPDLLLSDQVLGYYPLVDVLCLGDLGAENRLGGIAPSTMIRDGADLTNLLALLGAENPAVTTRAPVLVAQGDDDQTVFKFFTDSLVDELNGNADHVTYDVYPGVDHAGVVSAAEDDAMDFFQSRLPAP